MKKIITFITKHPLIFISILLATVVLISSAYFFFIKNNHKDETTASTYKIPKDNVWYYRNEINFLKDTKDTILVIFEINSPNKNLPSQIIEAIKKDILDTINYDSSNSDGDVDEEYKIFINNIKSSLVFPSNVNISTSLDLERNYIGIKPENYIFYDVEYFENENITSFLVKKAETFASHPGVSFLVFNYDKNNKELKDKDILKIFNLDKEKLYIKLMKSILSIDFFSGMPQWYIDDIKRYLEEDRLSFYVKDNKLHVLFDQCEIIACVVGAKDFTIDN